VLLELIIICPNQMELGIATKQVELGIEALDVIRLAIETWR
jgi:hypothetical protein